MFIRDAWTYVVSVNSGRKIVTWVWGSALNADVEKVSIGCRMSSARLGCGAKKMRKKFLSQKRVPLPPAIKILAERNIFSKELDLDIDPETYAVLAQAGWETIQKDKDALVNYAIVKAMEDLVQSEKEKDARHIA
jgi:hypothetical protein